MKKQLIISALGLALLTPLAQAQFAKPENAIEYRQASFKLIANHFSRIGAVVKGEKPFNKEEVVANAALISSLSSLPWHAFGPGTEGGKSQPEIWTEADKFKAAGDKMQKAVADLNTAAKSGDLENIKKAFGATGQTCKACHDSYRKK